MSKPTLCLDFDGVIHSYSSGWLQADFIPDPPVPGAFDFIYRALEHFNVVIFSSRSHQGNGIRAMQLYMEFWARRELTNDDPDYQANAVINAVAWNKDAFPLAKPSAFLSIDDRALQFNGRWDTFNLQDMLKFKPWNKL